MLKNYFKTAWRNLWTNKVYSIINIMGLAMEGVGSYSTNNRITITVIQSSALPA